MNREEVLAYQEDMARKFRYRELPPLFRAEALQFYSDNLPDGFSLDGDSAPLFTSEGLKICNRYNRIVIGDYGAFVEILPDDVLHENLKVKEGQEYRDFDLQYANVKYSWLTARDNSDIKIYFQKKPVDYADYVPGRYYISPFDCYFSKALVKDSQRSVLRSEIRAWLSKQGVFSNELLDYYDNLSALQGNVIRVSIDNGLSPVDTERWMKLNELCNIDGGLSFSQFSNVQYNLDLIGCTGKKLQGPFNELDKAVKTAIKMGLEDVSFPLEMDKFSADVIRFIIGLSIDDLLDVSRFCKVVAGCKGEELNNVLEPTKTVENSEKTACIDTLESKIQAAKEQRRSENNCVRFKERLAL